MSFKGLSLGDLNVNSEDKTVKNATSGSLNLSSFSVPVTSNDSFSFGATALSEPNLAKCTTLSCPALTPGTSALFTNVPLTKGTTTTSGSFSCVSTGQSTSCVFGKNSLKDATLNSSIITPSTTANFTFNSSTQSNSSIFGTAVPASIFSSSVSSTSNSTWGIPVITAAAKKMQEDFIKLLVSEEDSDITIKVEGKEIRSHKAILRARSPVFKTMLSHEMIEKSSGSVTIEDFDISTFRDFLHFVYSGDIECINEKNVCNLYKVSDKYDVKELKRACLIFMEKKLSVSLFCDVLSLALLHGERNLTDVAIKFFCSNAEAIIETPNWISFLSSNLIAGNELFLKALSANKKSTPKEKRRY